MKQRIKRIDPMQAAKIMSILYGIAGLIIAPLFYFAQQMSPTPSPLGPGFIIAIPVLYAVCGAIITAISAALYNLVAGWVGGVEVELE